VERSILHDLLWKNATLYDYAGATITGRQMALNFVLEVAREDLLLHLELVDLIAKHPVCSSSIQEIDVDVKLPSGK
jgi:hypothetical protein